MNFEARSVPQTEESEATKRLRNLNGQYLEAVSAVTLAKAKARATRSPDDFAAVERLERALTKSEEWIAKAYPPGVYRHEKSTASRPMFCMICGVGFCDSKSLPLFSCLPFYGRSPGKRRVLIPLVNYADPDELSLSELTPVELLDHVEYQLPGLVASAYFLATAPTETEFLARLMHFLGRSASEQSCS